MDENTTTTLPPVSEVEPYRTRRDEIDDIMLEARDVETLQRLVLAQQD